MTMVPLTLRKRVDCTAINRCVYDVETTRFILVVGRKGTSKSNCSICLYPTSSKSFCSQRSNCIADYNSHAR